MGYLGNLSRDVRGSLGPPKLYKSLRDSPSFKEKGYRFAYNLGTVGAMTGAKVGGVRGGIYDSLQAANSMNSILKGREQASRARSGVRRLTYRMGARALGAIVHQFLPTGAGLIGRYIRVSAGKVTSKQLRRLDLKVREQLYGEFILKSEAMDRKAKDRRSNVALDMNKIAQTMQAMAISMAPDPYVTEKYNRKRGDLQYGDEHGVMSAFSLSTYEGDDPNSLLSRRDISLIMGENALQSYDVEKKMTSGSVTKGAGYNDFYVNKYTGAKTNAINPEQFGEEVAMDMATYQFGASGGLSDTVLKDVKEFASGVYAVYSDITDKKLIGNETTNYQKNLDSETLKQIVARNIIDTQQKGGDSVLRSLGSKHGLLRYLHGDDGDISNRSETETVLKKRNMEGPLEVSPFPPVQEEKRFHQSTNRYAGAKGEPSIFDEVASKQKKIDGKYKNRRNKNERWRDEYVTEKRKVKDTMYTEDRLTTNMSDKPSRHNFTPNKRQIQSAIHLKDPEHGSKSGNATVQYRVTFGGANKNSEKNDAIRDSYQIEFGGPATDRQGKLYNRTDMMVYTPSLFMYRALLGTSKMYGLDASSKQKGKDIGYLSSSIPGIKATQGGSPDFGTAVQSASVRAPYSEQKKILDEIYNRAMKDANGNMLIKNGQVMLDKSKVLRSAYGRAELEVVSDTLDDMLFGGQRIMQQFRTGEKVFDSNKRFLGTKYTDNEFEGRRGFDKVFDKGFTGRLEEEGKIRSLLLADAGYKQNVIEESGFEKFFKGQVVHGKQPRTDFFESELVGTEDGVEIWQITNYRLDMENVLRDDKGKPFVVGNYGMVGNRYDTNLSSVVGDMDTNNAAFIEDLRLLEIDLETDAGLAQLDKALSQGALASNTSQRLAVERLHSKLAVEVRKSLKGLNIEDADLGLITHQVTTELLTTIENNVIGLTPEVIAVVEAHTVNQLAALKKAIQDNSLASFNFDDRLNKIKPKIVEDGVRGRSKRKVTNVDSVGDSASYARATQNQDAFISQLIHNEDFKNMLNNPKMAGILRDVSEGKISLNDALQQLETESSKIMMDNLKRLHTQLELDAEGNIIPPMGKYDSTIRTEGWKISSATGKQKISESNSGWSGAPSSADRGVSGYDQKVSNKAKAARKSFSGLKAGDRASQVAFVKTEIQRLKRATNSRNREAVKKEILAMCAHDTNVKSAWHAYIESDSTQRSFGLKGSRRMETIFAYLDRWYPIGNVITSWDIMTADNQSENPDLFE